MRMRITVELLPDIDDNSTAFFVPRTLWVKNQGVVVTNSLVSSLTPRVSVDAVVPDVAMSNVHGLQIGFAS